VPWVLEQFSRCRSVVSGYSEASDAHHSTKYRQTWLTDSAANLTRYYVKLKTMTAAVALCNCCVAIGVRPMFPLEFRGKVNCEEIVMGLSYSEDPMIVA